jgi:hypothetical protein
MVINKINGVGINQRANNPETNTSLYMPPRSFLDPQEDSQPSQYQSTNSLASSPADKSELEKFFHGMVVFMSTLVIIALALPPAVAAISVLAMLLDFMGNYYFFNLVMIKLIYYCLFIFCWGTPALWLINKYYRYLHHSS